MAVERRNMLSIDDVASAVISVAYHEFPLCRPRPVLNSLVFYR